MDRWRRQRYRLWVNRSGSVVEISIFGSSGSMLVEEIGACGGDHWLLLSDSLCSFSLSPFILLFLWLLLTTKPQNHLCPNLNHQVWEIFRRKRGKNKEKKEGGKGEQERWRWFREKEKERWVGPCGELFVWYDKKLKKYYYLNKIDSRIDKMIYVFCKCEYVK